MTIAELVEKLDEFGDFLQVVATFHWGSGDEKTFSITSEMDTEETSDGEQVLVLRIGPRVLMK